VGEGPLSALRAEMCLVQHLLPTAIPSIPLSLIAPPLVDLGRASFPFRSRRLPTPCRRRQRSSPERETSGFRNSRTTASRSSSDTSSVLRKATATASCAGVWSFAVGALCGCGHLHYRACATSTLSVRLCLTAPPEPKQARHSVEYPPALWVSSSPGYED
jgi:hypothetical protein